MEIKNCKEKCCSLKISDFDYSRINKNYKPRYKAGVFLYSPISKKILIVQSNGKLWGCPKGTIKKNEKIQDCAIREVFEETGIKLDKDFLKIHTVIKNKATYYFVEMDEVDLEIQDKKNNDVNSLGWIKTSCLIEFIKKDEIKVNKHFKIVLYRFLNINI